MGNSIDKKMHTFTSVELDTITINTVEPGECKTYYVEKIPEDFYKYDVAGEDKETIFLFKERSLVKGRMKTFKPDTYSNKDVVGTGKIKLRMNGFKSHIYDVNESFFQHDVYRMIVKKVKGDNYDEQNQ